jgi:hypothetical protein
MPYCRSKARPAGAKLKKKPEGEAQCAAKPRAEWIPHRKAANRDGNFSQMHYAREGGISEKLTTSPATKLSLPGHPELRYPFLDGAALSHRLP